MAALPQQLRRAACALHMYFLLSCACCLALGGSLTERAHTDSPANSSRDPAHRDLNGQGPQVVVFGDSLSDVGNVYNFTDGFMPSRGRYWAGRYADGPGWLDQLATTAAAAESTATATGQRQQQREGPGGAAEPQGPRQGRRQSVESAVLDFAFGGSTACPSQARVSAMVPSLAAQVDSYLAGKRPAATVVTSRPRNTTTTSFRTTTDAGGGGTAPWLQAPAGTRCTHGLLRPQPRWLAPTPNTTSRGAGSPPPQLLAQRRIRRVIHVWTGHNDFLGGAADWSDPLVGPALAANVSACIGAALDRIVAAAEQEAAAAPHAAANAVNTSASASDAAGSGGDWGGGVTYLVVWTLAPVDLAPALPDAFRPQAKAAVAALNANLEAHVRRLRRQQQERRQRTRQQQEQKQSGAVRDPSQASQPHLPQKRKLRRNLRRLQQSHQQPEPKPLPGDDVAAVSAASGGRPAPAPPPPAGVLVVPLLFDANAAISCAALQPEAVGLSNGNTSCLQFPPPLPHTQQGLSAHTGNSSSKGGGGMLGMPLATGAFLQVAAADAATPCPDPSAYLWYDGMHLTAAADARLIVEPLQRAGLGLGLILAPAV